jgi:hypothetical protein
MTFSDYSQLISIEEWTSSTNAASINFDIAKLPVDLTAFNCVGTNTISGDIAKLPVGLAYFTCGGNTTISGDIAKLPVDLIEFNCAGVNTISGDIAELPVGLTSFTCTGSNTISGNIAELPVDIINFACRGSNTISGDIAEFAVHITCAGCMGVYTIAVYTSPRTWASNYNRIVITSSAGSLSQSEIINLIIDLAGVVWGGTSRAFTVTGGHASLADTTQGGLWGTFDGETSPSATATAFKTLVKTRTVTTSLNGISNPGTTGDGTGFPAGFGNWWRA